MERGAAWSAEGAAAVEAVAASVAVLSSLVTGATNPSGVAGSDGVSGLDGVVGGRRVAAPDGRASGSGPDAAVEPIGAAKPAGTGFGALDSGSSRARAQGLEPSRGACTSDSPDSASFGADAQGLEPSRGACTSGAGFGALDSESSRAGAQGLEPSRGACTSDSLDSASFGADAGALEDSDPLRVMADGCLDALAEVARLEARTAALKARLLTQYVDAARGLAPSAGSPAEATAQELSVVAEIACVLTVSERTASGLIGDAHALTGLPLTAAALSAGRISWQHARIIIDQTATLDRAGAASLEEHFLHPDTPALANSAGELVPARFRAKVRTWRERHHRDSIEERHAKSVRDRRVEYVPDADGMAWLSAYLPAGTAAGIWNRTTAAARACQGRNEPRTLAQLRADITATWLLTTNELPRVGGLPDGGPGVKGSSAPATGVAVLASVPSNGADVAGGAPTVGIAVPGSAPTNDVAVPGSAPTTDVAVPGSAPTNDVAVPGSAPTTDVAVPGSAPSDGAHVPGSAPPAGAHVPGSAPSDGAHVAGSALRNLEATDDDGVPGLPDRGTGDADILRNGPRLPDTVPGLPGGADVIPDGVPHETVSNGGVCQTVPVPRAQVLVTVPVLSLLGVTEEAAMLDGYGPIPPSMARDLVAGGAGSFYRVLTDPRDGAPLEIGRTSYRLTKAMRQWLRLRDGKCPFPGCGNQSPDNEADHLLAWAKGGTTGISNLGQPCPKHHRLKHGAAWTPTRADKHHPPGWTSPSGRQYPSEHQDWEPPHLPDTITHRNQSPGRDASSAIPPAISPHQDVSYPPAPGYDPDLPEDLLPEDPDLQQDRELPPDPLPDWRSFITAHPWPESDPHDLPDDEALPSYPVPIDDPIRGHPYVRAA
ncbi:DUF222 domain-containing protein [Arthrobacter sp. NyZ413]|uniref:DUF222 domain-containing protein n=1 Tax=Arthrobacter sp. NyZ413 TaxID=3144669 RepID=UPI003BF81034